MSCSCAVQAQRDGEAPPIIYAEVGSLKAATS